MVPPHSLDDIEQIPIIKIEKIREDAFIPERAHETDSGYDCRIPENIILRAGQLIVVSLGFRIQLPRGWECQMRSRSGIASKYSVLFALGIGTIDNEYRGEIKIPLINASNTMVRFDRGTKISQMVFKKIDRVRIMEDKIDTNTDRGEGGFGSTGLS
jgi:dUTP pyrophosphatase